LTPFAIAIDIICNIFKSTIGLLINKLGIKLAFECGCSSRSSNEDLVPNPVKTPDPKLTKK
ncbi:MAG: hypothetical protein WCP39_01055, partial [Chlamydiota bacterium]